MDNILWCDDLNKTFSAVHKVFSLDHFFFQNLNSDVSLLIKKKQKANCGDKHMEI